VPFSSQERKRLAKILAIAQRKQTLDCLKELDKGDGVARDTFVLAVLEQLGILNRENDIEPWIKVRSPVEPHLVCCYLLPVCTSASLMYHAVNRSLCFWYTNCFSCALCRNLRSSM
jgi:ferredoxin-like protein FixX